MHRTKQPTQIDIIRAMDDFLGGDTMSIVNATFASMNIAEEEIAASGCSLEDGQRSFGILCPSKSLRGKCSDVYRAHCKELIARVQVGDDTRPGTKAEVLCYLLTAALKAPIAAAGLALAEDLFTSCFPGKLPAGWAREVYKGQVAEDLVDARRLVAVRDRVVS